MCTSRLGCDWLNGCLTFWHLGRNIHRGAFSAQPWRPLTGCFKACGRFNDRFVSSCANTLDVRHLSRTVFYLNRYTTIYRIRLRQTRFRSWMGSWPGFLAYSAQISVLPSRWISPCFEFVRKVLTLLPQLCIPALRCCWAILSRKLHEVRMGTCSDIPSIKNSWWA